NTLWFSAAFAPPNREQLIYAANTGTPDNENPCFKLQYLSDIANRQDCEGRAVPANKIGEHHTPNLLAATAAASAAGMGRAKSAQLPPTIAPRAARRMARTGRADGITIVDDAHNANPESMRAGLKPLARSGRNAGRRTWAVLGPMPELGDQHAKAHILLGKT